MPEQVQNETEQTATAVYGEEEKNAVGEQLRKQRKARGISLIEISEHTKIGKKYLEALENEEYQVLPGETYAIGFLRAYAKYLELDEVAILKQYKEQKNLPQTKADSGPEGTGGKGESNQSLWLPLLAVLVLAGLGAGLFLLWPQNQEHFAAKSSVADTVNSDLQVSQASLVPQPQAPVTTDLTLKIHAKERTWVTLMIDGRQEPDVTLNANEERTWAAKDRFVLWTGNAGGIDVTFNGEVQPPLGTRGEVRKEVIFERKPAVSNVAAPAASAVQPRPAVQQ